MTGQFYICAGWLDPEETIGVCVIESARGRETISFSYDKLWLNRHPGLVLDPNLFQMEGRQYPPEGIPCFGFLSDIAPDRWGRTLMDRREGIEAKKERRQRKRLSESDYILGVNDAGRTGGIRLRGDEGRYLSEGDFLAAPPMERLRDLEEASLMLEAGTKDEEHWIKTLLQPGSSLGGARPKSNVLDEEGNLWIAKFPSKKDEVDVGAWEMVAHNLAEKCGINVPEAKAMRFSDTGTTFLTKRFDRNGKKRVHYSSAMSILGLGDMEPAGYLDIIGAIENLSPHPNTDLKELWNRLVFNISVSNTDDHLRNHGFLLYEDQWRLSPAFDINPSVEKDEMALTIDKTNSKDLNEVYSIAEYFRLSKEEARDSVSKIQRIVRDNWQLEASRMRIPRREQEYMRTAFECAD